MKPDKMVHLDNLASSVHGCSGSFFLSKNDADLLPKLKYKSIEGVESVSVSCKEFCEAVSLAKLQELEKSLDDESDNESDDESDDDAVSNKGTGKSKAKS